MRRPDLPEWGFKATTALHRALFERSGGRLGRSMFGMEVVLLTTTGRKTGQKHTITLTAIPDGDDLLVVASKGGNAKHPAWYLNLVANPEVEVQRGRRTRAMTARPASPEERQRLWPLVTKTYKGYAGYQERAEREIPVVILRDA